MIRRSDNKAESTTEHVGCGAEHLVSGVRCEYPSESKGLGDAWRHAEIHNLAPGVNDESMRLVSGFRATRHELELLAQHYVEVSEERSLFLTVIGSKSLDADEIFARRRLDTICGALGEADFEKAVASSRKKWRDEWAKEFPGKNFVMTSDPEDHDPTECAREARE